MAFEKGSSWIRNAVIYQVFIDRFAGYDERLVERWDEPIFLGGNIKGLISKLPYLHMLGIDAIWLSPFCENADYHGYHLRDFKAVDSRFGTEEDVDRLVRKCHEEYGIKLIADFVPNHLHWSCEIFKEAMSNPESDYRNWFYFDSHGGYQKFFNLEHLPKVNLEYVPARDYMVDAGMYWLGRGFDGLRIDHAVGLPHSFYKELSCRVKEGFPEAVLFGEAIIKPCDFKVAYKELFIGRKFWRRLFRRMSQDALQREYVGLIDGVLDFYANELMLSYLHGDIYKLELEEKLALHYKRYPDGFVLPMFLDSHDQNRLMYECGNEHERFRDISEVMFKVGKKYGQPVIIYYGTEIGMRQLGPKLAHIAHADLMFRRPMQWSKTVKKDGLLEFYHNLIGEYHEGSV